MADVIAIVNQGGGVGKSTTAWNIARTLAERGKRVLLIDFDPLSDIQKRLDGCRVLSDGSSMADGIANAKLAMGATYRCGESNLVVMTWGREVVELEIMAIDLPNREQLLSALLSDVAPDYDYVVIDAPSSIGLLTMNALVAAQRVVVPLRCDYFSLEMMPELMRTIAEVTRELNRVLTLEGFLITHVNPKLRSAVVNINHIRRCYGEKVLNTMICETTDPDELGWCYEKLIDELFV